MVIDALFVYTLARDLILEVPRIARRGHWIQYKGSLSSKQGPKMDQQIIKNWTKVDKKSTKDRSKNRLKIDRKSMVLGSQTVLGPNMAPKWILREVEGVKIKLRLVTWPPCWGPSWSQVATKIHFEVGLNFDPTSEGILEHLGLDFGGVLGVKMESISELKIRSVKTWKFDSRLGGSLVLEVPGGSKINKKSIKNRLQDKTSA